MRAQDEIKHSSCSSISVEFLHPKCIHARFCIFNMCSPLSLGAIFFSFKEACIYLFHVEFIYVNLRVKISSGFSVSHLRVYFSWFSQVFIKRYLFPNKQVASDTRRKPRILWRIFIHLLEILIVLTLAL